MRHSHLSRAIRVSLCLAALSGGLGASGSLLAQNETINLGSLGTRGFQINGPDFFGLSSESVAVTGDVNGDGLADLIVSHQRANPNGRTNAGTSYVVFGKADNTPIDLGALGNGGFRLNGAEAYDNSGFEVSGAGDVNGDGLEDLIVGARNADPGGRNDAGSSFVVFGKADGADVDLGALGDGGFRIDGVNAENFSGQSVSGAGDVNGDGFADLIIGSFDFGGNAGSEPDTYVVFGKDNGTDINLGMLGGGGFKITFSTGTKKGYSVSGAGDVNGDGLDDVIVGVPGFTSAYVVFGKDNADEVNLFSDFPPLGDKGFKFETSGDNYSYTGASVSGAGDVNGDGLADFIVGAPRADHGGRVDAGSSYVVFGTGFGGFQLDGVASGDMSGRSVAGAGDVNGDGLADLIIGAYGADPAGQDGAGSSYVVFGKADGSPVNLGALGDGGFQLDGSVDVAGDGHQAGFSVSGGGDVNGDGVADVIIGAPYAGIGANRRTGVSYVVFGPGPNVNLSVAANAGSEADATQITVTATAASAVSGDKTVDLAVTDSGGGPGITAGDFTLSDTTITIPDGQSSGSVTFTIVDDNLVEGAETATLTLSNPSSGISIGTTDTQNIAITDNDAVAVQSVNFDTMAFAEDGGVAMFEVVVSNPSTVADTCYTVGFGGDALLGTDFSSEDDQPASMGTTEVCVPADGVSTTGTITLTGLGDAFFEGNESVTATASGMAANTSITDAETAPTVDALAFDMATFSEEAGTNSLTLSQSGTAAAERCYTVTFGGTANQGDGMTPGDDFAAGDDDTMAADTQICVPAMATTGSIDLTGISDTIFESNETITADANGVMASTELTSDDDAPMVTALGFTPMTFDENGSTTLTLTTSNPSSTQSCFTVDLTTGTAQPSDDFNSEDDDPDNMGGTAGTQICVDGDDTSTAGGVMVTGIEDMLFEGSETVIAVSGDPGNEQSANATLQDGDDPPSLSMLAFGDVSFSEEGGSTTLTATQSGAATTERCYTVTFAGTATLSDGVSPGDYTAEDDDAMAANTQICVPATATTGSIDLTGISDTIFEASETIIADANGSMASTELTSDDGAPMVDALVFSPMSFDENGSTTLTLTASNPSSTQSCFTILFTTGTAQPIADFNVEDDDPDNMGGAAGTQVCVVGDDTSTEGSVIVTGIEDMLFEGDETVTASTSDPATGPAASATLQDGDVVPNLTMLAFADASFSEESASIALTATQSGAAATERCYTVTFDGTATQSDGVSPGDYTAEDDDPMAANTQICVPATATTGSIDLTGIGDTIFEANETIIADANGFMTSTEVLSDDDAPVTAALSFSPTIFGENASTTLTLTASNPSSTQSCFTVDLTTGTAQPGDDFSSEDDDPDTAGGTAGTQVCVDGDGVSTAGSVIVTGIEDMLFEGDEAIIAASGDLGNEQSANATLEDGDVAPSLTMLAFADASFSEEGGVTTLTATQSDVAAIERCYTVTFEGTATLSDGVSSGDYTAADDDAMAADIQICVPASATTGSIDLTGVSDTSFEPVETIAAETNGVMASTELTSDDGMPTVATLDFNPTTFGEDGSTTLTLTASNPSSTQSCFTVDLTTGTAQPVSDFIAEDDDPDNLGGAAGNQICIDGDDASISGSVTITGVEDILAEGNETVTAISGGPGNEQSASATLQDGDATPGITQLAFGDTSFSEEGGTTTLMATQSSAASTEHCYTVTFDGEALETIDYSAGDDSTGPDGDPGTQICVPATTTTGEITITGLTDTIFEPNESITADVNGVMASTELTSDDDAPVVTALNFSPINFAENRSTTLALTTSNASATEICFTVDLTTGTAQPGDDFNSEDDDPVTAGTQICVDGDEAGTSGSIVITGIEDLASDEGTETVIAASGGLTANANLVDGVSITDLAIDKIGSRFITLGQSVAFEILVSNVGTSDVSDAQMVDIFPAELQNAQWTCTEFENGICGAVSGNGDINESVDLPIDGSVLYQVVADLNPAAYDEEGSITNTATVSAQGDEDLANNTNSHTLGQAGLFVDGFEDDRL